MTQKQAVTFAILMGAQSRILQQAPSYLAEKLKLCEGTDERDLPGLLDGFNQGLYFLWCDRWLGERRNDADELLSKNPDS